jgi:hypothetical protein
VNYSAVNLQYRGNPARLSKTPQLSCPSIAPRKVVAQSGRGIHALQIIAVEDSIAWVVSNYLPAPFQRDRLQARRRDLFEIPDAALIVPAVALTSTSSARSVIRSRAFFTFRRRYCNSADRWNGLKETQFSLIKGLLDSQNERGN